jgi:hypothetical protein
MPQLESVRSWKTPSEFTAPTGTAAAVAPSVAAANRVFVQALSSNTASIFIGPDPATAAANGLELTKGMLVEVPVTDPALIFAIAGSGGQKLRVAIF